MPSIPSVSPHPMSRPDHRIRPSTRNTPSGTYALGTMATHGCAGGVRGSPSDSDYPISRIPGRNQSARLVSALHRLGVVCEAYGVNEVDLTRLHLDVYDTRNGPWNPEHGKLEIPPDWDFLPSGDAFVTRTVKALGTYWVAWRPRGRNRSHRRRLGLWAPRVAIEQAQKKASATEAERARRRVQGARSRERQEVAYREELADAIRRFLEFPPQWAELADEIAEAASAQTAVVGSGRVGRTRTLSLDQRAALAARAYIRHHLTGYHDALLATEDSWDDEYLYRQIKADAQHDVDKFLAKHRRPAT